MATWTWTMSIGHGGGNGDNAKKLETVKDGNSQPGLRCNDIWALTPLLCLCSGCNEEKLEQWVKTGADFEEWRLYWGNDGCL